MRTARFITFTVVVLTGILSIKTRAEVRQDESFANRNVENVNDTVEDVVTMSFATVDVDSLNQVMVSSTVSQLLVKEDPIVVPSYIPESGAAGSNLHPSIYALPVSWTGHSYDWRRLWINTGALTAAYVGTLIVLQFLPEDATRWNRAEIIDVPLFKRWENHVLKQGPEWDTDKFYFDYILHPYAGAAYFMSARSCGFNFWQSFLYSAIVSTVGWEYGIEAFMERPSYQDLIITPVVGSLIGEGFYRLKRRIVMDDYHLFGSPVLGNIVAFLIDPINEFIGYFGHNPARQVAKALHYDDKKQDVVFSPRDRGEGVSMSPMVYNGFTGFSLTATF